MLAVSTLLASNTALGFVAAGLMRPPFAHPRTRAQEVVMFEESFDDSFARMARMAQQFERMFNDEFFSATPALEARARGRGGGSGHSALQALDKLMTMPSLKDDSLAVDESDKEYTITMDAPGVEEGDVRVSVKGGVLTVAGETSRQDEGSSYRSSFRRSLRLPANADAKALASTFEDGKVTIALPKKMLSPSAAPKKKKKGGAPPAAAPASSADEILRSLQAEAAALAEESPRFARWLEASGFHRDGSPKAPSTAAKDGKAGGRTPTQEIDEDEPEF